MSTETNKLVARRFFEAFDKLDWDAALAVLSTDLKAYTAGMGGPMDRAAFEGFGRAFAEAFSQGRHVVLSQVAEGDMVATRGEWSAVNTGPFNGMPATNRPVKVDMTVFDVVRDGRIVEHRALFDMATMMGQLGAIPAAA
jgi:steroid delta-isomerase-like uncharacterized protein